MSGAPVSIVAYRVSLAGVVVAHLFRREDHVWLEWQDGYWDDPGRPVLGLAFEDRPGQPVSSHLKLPPWFSNLLPEGRLREWVARDANVSPAREMMLLAHLGRDLPGAVVVDEVASGAVDPTWRPDVPAALSEPVAVGRERLRFSLAGVAFKFSMLKQGDRLTLPARGEGGNWILKLPDSAHGLVPLNEMAMMSMARFVGIEVPEIRLFHRDELPPLPGPAWPASEEWAFGIERFDRTPEGRVHTEDLAQVRSRYPEAKYQGAFESVAALVYRDRDESSYLEFVRRLFFSFAVGNGDMHLKNVSLIYRDPRRPVISPAYDIVCTAPYLDDEEDLGLKLAGSKRFVAVTPESFSKFARRVGAPESATMEAVGEVASRLAGAWEEVRDQMTGLPVHRKYLDERLPGVGARFS